MLIHNILSPTEINDILNNPVVQTHKAYLSNTDVVKFSLPLAPDIRDKLSTRLGISLSSRTIIPMRWIKGDTLPHIDRGESQFTKTHLVYLTSSSGNLVIDGQAYPIHAGDAHIFSEGLEHFTINTGTTERLLLGPMSETGFGVGATVYIKYFESRADAENENSNWTGSSTYTVQPVNDISAWVIYTNEYGTSPSPDGGPYNSGTELVNTGVYWVYPYIAPPPQPQLPLLFCGSIFSNNAQVYYKSHSLSTGSGGSGVRNSRYKKRRT